MYSKKATCSYVYCRSLVKKIGEVLFSIALRHGPEPSVPWVPSLLCNRGRGPGPGSNTYTQRGRKGDENSQLILAVKQRQTFHTDTIALLMRQNSFVRGTQVLMMHKSFVSATRYI